MHRSWKRFAQARGGWTRSGTARVDTASGAVFIDTPFSSVDPPPRWTRASLFALVPQPLHFTLHRRGWLSRRGESLGAPAIEAHYVGSCVVPTPLPPLFEDRRLLDALLELRREAPKASLGASPLFDAPVADPRWGSALEAATQSPTPPPPVPAGRELVALQVSFQRRVKREAEFAAGVEALDALAQRLSETHGLERTSDSIERWWRERPYLNPELVETLMLRGAETDGPLRGG